MRSTRVDRARLHQRASRAPSSQSAVGSSLKRSVGYASSRSGTGSAAGGSLESQRDDEGHRPRLPTDCLARARAPPAEARGRVRRFRRPSGGSRRNAAMPGPEGKSASPSRSCEKLSSVWLPASGSVGPSACNATWSSPE